MFERETGVVADHPYVRFGDGPRRLVVLPGASDAMYDGEIEALGGFLRWYYRAFAKTHRVVVLSRPRGLPEGHTTADMAAGTVRALTELDIDRTDVLGLSLGGLVAQELALDFPDRVARLALGVSGCRLGAEGATIVQRWGRYARLENWEAIASESVTTTYTGWRRPVYGLLSELTRSEPAVPRDVWVTMAAAHEHDTCDRLADIESETLVIGGGADELFPATVLRQTAAAIPTAELELYPGIGHGAFSERKRRFDRRVRRFLVDGPTAARTV